MKKIITILFITTSVGSFASEPDNKDNIENQTYTSEMYESCKKTIEISTQDGYKLSLKEAYQIGSCYSFINFGIYTLMMNGCKSSLSLNPDIASKMFVKYIENNPERINFPLPQHIFLESAEDLLGCEY